MHVLKFGGSSVANAECIRQVASIIHSRAKPGVKVFVVVSAFSGMTDLLLSATHKAGSGEKSYADDVLMFTETQLSVAESLLGKDGFREILSTLKSNHQTLRDLLKGVYLIQEASLRTIDHIISFGERNSAFIITEYMKTMGFNAAYRDARQIIKTDKSFGSAKVDYPETYKNIRSSALEDGDVFIITGFIGSDRASGLTTTLGRGGSDYTAALFAGALSPDCLEIWTDVDGVLTSDPRRVLKAFSISEMSYREAMEMSHFGAKVIYPPTIRPVLENNIPVYIKNTFNPDHPGTKIHIRPAYSNKLIARGLSAIPDISLVSLEGSGMQGIPGIASRLFRALSSKNINVIMITQASSEQSITFGIKSSDIKEAADVVMEAFSYEIDRHLIDPVVVHKNLSLVAVIGEDMKNSPGVAGRLFDALGQNGINVEAIAQGSSELNITFAVNNEDLNKALTVTHDAFFLSDTKTINLFIIGVGLVGKTLIRQIEEHTALLREKLSLDVRVIGLANSKKMLFDEGGIALSHWHEQLKGSNTVSDPEAFVGRMIELNLPNAVFVDNTANKQIPQFYMDILSNSISVSTPNKVAASSKYSEYKNLLETAHKNNVHFKFETNVGAGLPVISTMRNLIASGDKIHSIEAVLSGSVSYIFNHFNPDARFGAIVRKAMELGLTEPDPREDLSGADVARKTIILSREAGYPAEPEDVEIGPILPDKCTSARSVEDFFDALDDEEQTFNSLIKRSVSENKRLRYIAKIDPEGIRIDLRAVPPESPFYTLSGSDNMIVFNTLRYNKTPLVIRGPGAGAEVTAAGVFAEIISIHSHI